MFIGAGRVASCVCIYLTLSTDASLSTLVDHTVVLVYFREFGYHILFGACRNEGNHREFYTLPGTQLTVKQ